MNRLSLRNNWSKFKTLGRYPFILEEIVKYTSNYLKKIWKDYNM